MFDPPLKIEVKFCTRSKMLLDFSIVGLENHTSS